MKGLKKKKKFKLLNIYEIKKRGIFIRRNKVDLIVVCSY